MPKKKAPSKKSSSQIFTKSNANSTLTQDEKQRPVFQEEIKTYRLHEKGEGTKRRFVLYELDRKKKPKRIQTMRANKKDTSASIIKRIKENEIKIKEKVITVDETHFKVVQANYKATKKKFQQIVALFQIDDIRRKITDHFLGFSKKHPDLTDAQQINQCKKMALAKFYSVYGNPKKSSDMVATLIEIRYQYYYRKYR